MKSYLFCDGELVREYDTDCPKMDEWLHSNFRLGIYNRGYLFTRQFSDKDRQWYRPDYTPVLPQDVPKEYKMLVLLLG